MRGRYVIAAAAAAMLVWAAAALAIVSTDEDKKASVSVVVPRVLGLRGTAAATKLEAAGLEVFADAHLLPFQRSSIGWNMTTKQSLAGVVVAQSPAAGARVHRGSTIELSVAHESRAPEAHPGA